MSNFRVGDRVRLQEATGTITELLDDRAMARVTLDDGRPVTCDLKLLLAAHDAPAVKDKALRGPREKKA